jgi:poly-gamma-glutamate synthesis protein (capsule biosynthesis protein)
MRLPYHKFLSLIFLTMLLASCVPPSGDSVGGIQLPDMEIPLRGVSEPESVVVVPTATATQPPVPTVTATQTGPTQTPTETATVTPLPYPLWIEPSVPDKLRETALTWGLPVAETESAASLHLGLAETTDSTKTTWIFALVAPFPTVDDGVVLAELESAWRASSSGPVPESPLWMTESTLSAMTAIFGEAGEGAVATVSADELIDSLWVNQPSWGIVPFEMLDPKLKVLSIDKQSPVRNDFDEAAYPLKIDFTLAGTESVSFELPISNREASKLTVVLMTGVTALVRAIATRLEIVGLDYPAWNIGETLKAADITHISNEVPFYTGCPYPDPRQEDLVFCSNPEYIELLELVGTDVVELTGNHFQDYGTEATLQTLEMYKERQWPYFGGGENLEDARKPALLTHNGNRFAFIGCNPAGPPFAWATESQPGAAPCYDYEWMKTEIAGLTEKGYIVIATFQYIEYYDPEPLERHVEDFRMIADAGATIVSGSQAHIPQAMEFYESSFIHYGLGNLFFDQMDGPSRREFLDRHVFYEGRYISTELLTAMLEDFARPRPMRTEERRVFLEKMFGVSGWTDVSLEE